IVHEGIVFKSLGNVHPTFATPIPSLITQAGLSCVFILSGTFDQLTNYVVFASWIFYAMSAGAVFILRNRSPDTPRSYKTWGYPFTPILFILFSLVLVGYNTVGDPRSAFIVCLIVLCASRVYRAT